MTISRDANEDNTTIAEWQPSFGAELYPVDYDTEYALAYAACRVLSPGQTDQWLTLFAEHLGLNPTTRFLDIGCGNGNFTEAVAQRFRCAVTGLDESEAMLRLAAKKRISGARWVLGQAEHAPLTGECFDVCLMSYVLHHIPDSSRQQALREACRVLDRGGRLGIRYSTLGQLRQMLEYTFFEAAWQIDQRRTPGLELIADYLERAGFREVLVFNVMQKYIDSPQDYLKKLEQQYTSGLRAAFKESPAAYEAGLARAREYLATHTLTTKQKQQEITFLVATKA